MKHSTRLPYAALALWALGSPSMGSPATAQEPPAIIGPTEHVYARVGDVGLRAYVFMPASAPPEGTRSAIVLFHGGGWYMGEPAWAFSRAQHFAELGMVAVAVQYRLSSPSTGVTPLEAMADARSAMRWVRARSGEFAVSPDRIAAYGWSAGAHLAVWTALPDDSAGVASRPDALVLLSPAVDVVEDAWMRRILGRRATPEDVSPDRHVRAGMPPTIIFQGRDDTVTPLAGSKRFCDRMRAAGNRCALHVYDGVGHLFTPSTESDKGWPNPDPEVGASAYREADRFLASLGFID